MEMIQTQVLIVGAGISGLSAAVHLASEGLSDFLVLEASDRIGGRILTQKFGKDDESTVEVGAQFIQGRALTSSVVSLANQFSLFDFTQEQHAERETGFLYRSDGKAIDMALSTKAVALFEQWLDEAGDSDINVETYTRQHLQKYLKKGKHFSKDDEEDLKSAFNFSLKYLQFCLGGILSDMPVRGAADCHNDIPGGPVIFSKMDRLIDCLRDRLHDDQVKLNHEVKEIFYRRHLGKPVRVTCTNGVILDCDHVIVTCPLGYLKQHAHTLFNPQLPLEKQKAIEHIGFGKIGKIFLLYEHPFWHKGNGRIALAWRDEEREMKDESEWYKNIACFDEVVDNSNVLTALVTYEGVDILEKLSDEEVKNTCVGLLRKFFNNPSIPEPKKILKSSWASNKLYGGTYCYLGNQTKPSHWEDLEAPVFDNDSPVIMFAGEAMRGIGGMHGARDSGLREAQRILDHHGMNRIPKL